MHQVRLVMGEYSNPSGFLAPGSPTKNWESQALALPGKNYLLLLLPAICGANIFPTSEYFFIATMSQ